MALALRRIRNNRAVLLLAKWPANLPKPIHAADTQAKARAVSLLRNLPTQDGEPVHACDLTPEQAQDVVEWFA